MTCIVGMVNEGKVYIGGDSAGVFSYDIVVRKDTKVFTVKTKYVESEVEAVFGFTSSFRMGQILMMHLVLPEYDEEDPYVYMVKSLIPEIINVFEEHKYATNNNGNLTGGEFLVGFKGRLFLIGDDFQVGESIDCFDACGCGEVCARGAIAATVLNCPDMKPEDHIRNALSIAEKYNGGVSGPFNMVVLD